MLVDEKQHQILKDLTPSLPDVILNDRQICDFELLVTGVFAPLDGFMTRMDYESVLDRMRLSSGALWPLPICLDIHDTLAAPWRPASPWCSGTGKSTITPEERPGK